MATLDSFCTGIQIRSDGFNLGIYCAMNKEFLVWQDYLFILLKHLFAAMIVLLKVE